MKIKSLLILIFVFAFTQITFSARYEYELNAISKDFLNNILDKDYCENLLSKADKLVSTIENATKKENLSSSERANLIEALNEAKALKNFIGVVGDAGDVSNSSITNTSIIFSDIYLANERIGAKIDLFDIKDPYVKLMRIIIGDYECYLLSNDKIQDCKVFYEWKAGGKMHNKSGKGEMPILSKSAIRINNNRDNTSIKGISVIITKSYLF